MALISWSDDLSVGIQILDNDHKVLVSIINELHDSMVRGAGEELIESVFERLLQYAATHFFREESLMQSYGYAKLDEHKKHHQDLVDELNKLKDQFLSDKNSIHQVQVMDFLRKWLVEHIKQDDFQYKPFFRTQGLV